MRTVKIVADSSADLITLADVDFSCTPLKVICAQQEFVDDENLNVDEMVDFFQNYKERSQTSCPNPTDYLDCFGDADDVFCVTITSGLSGSYNAACIAKQLYENDHPDRRVFVIDSLSAGPELRLTVEKLRQWILEGKDYETICQDIMEYREHTGLIFMLESLKNFAANGRISPAVAKITGFLGIRIMGQASTVGTLEPLHKCRGEAKTLSTMLQHIEKHGSPNGKVRISHCRNLAAAEKFRDLLLAKFPAMEIEINPLRGLCSYYAELGGMLVGFEKP